MILGGIDLGEDIYREGRFGHSRVDGRMVRTRNNTPLIFEQDAGPLAFDLVGGENIGTLTGSIVIALLALAGAIGGVYDLTYDGIVIPVRFRTWEQPVVDSDPLGDREKITDSDIFRNIRIKLMEA